MGETFNPYHKWLGIPPEDQPPHHYRLLAIKRFETDRDVIESAADQRMTHLRSYQTGRYAVLSQKLLNEVSAAKLCLLNVEKKAQYDRELRRRLQIPEPRPPPSPTRWTTRALFKLGRDASQEAKEAPAGSRANRPAPCECGKVRTVDPSLPVAVAAPRRKVPVWLIAVASGVAAVVLTVALLSRGGHDQGGPPEGNSSQSTVVAAHSEPATPPAVPPSTGGTQTAEAGPKAVPPAASPVGPPPQTKSLSNPRLPHRRPARPWNPSRPWPHRPSRQPGKRRRYRWRNLRRYRRKRRASRPPLPRRPRRPSRSRRPSSRSAAARCRRGAEGFQAADRGLRRAGPQRHDAGKKTCPGR